MSLGPHFVFHYLDDFTMAGRLGLDECWQSFHITQWVCDWLGVPWAEEKAAEPSTCITFWGVEFDTQLMQLRLPQEKQRHLRKLIREWEGRTYAIKKELQSLAGHLQSVCKVVRLSGLGWCFFRSG